MDRKTFRPGESGTANVTGHDARWHRKPALAAAGTHQQRGNTLARKLKQDAVSGRLLTISPAGRWWITACKPRDEIYCRMG
jgi:hypothetical protein